MMALPHDSTCFLAKTPRPPHHSPLFLATNAVAHTLLVFSHARLLQFLTTHTTPLPRCARVFWTSGGRIRDDGDTHAAPSPSSRLCPLFLLTNGEPRLVLHIDALVTP